MSRVTKITLQLQCLTFDPLNGSKAYALATHENAYILVQAVIPAADPHLFRWNFVSADWSLEKSHYLRGNAASCIMNRAGDLVAMESWNETRASDTLSRRGLVYNPHNPLPLVEGRNTSNALWMEVNVAANIGNFGDEMAQLMIDTGADDNSAMEIALTASHLLIRRLHAPGSKTRELVGLGGWTLVSQGQCWPNSPATGRITLLPWFHLNRLTSYPRIHPP